MELSGHIHDSAALTSKDIFPGKWAPETVLTLRRETPLILQEIEPLIRGLSGRSLATKLKMNKRAPTCAFFRRFH